MGTLFYFERLFFLFLFKSVMKEKQTEVSGKVPRNTESGGKTPQKSGQRRLCKRFLQVAAIAALDTRDKMDAKTAWRFDRDAQEQKARRLADETAKKRRAERFSLPAKPSVSWEEASKGLPPVNPNGTLAAKEPSSTSEPSV